METAWLAFAGVVVGAIIGFLGPVLTTWLTVRAQMDTTVLSTFLTARLGAYKDYEIAWERLSNERNQENIAAYYRAVNIAALFSSEETIQALGAVQNMVREYETQGKFPDLNILGEKNVLLTIAMRQDLLKYPVSTPVFEKSPRILHAMRTLLKPLGRTTQDKKTTDSE